MASADVNASIPERSIPDGRISPCRSSRFTGTIPSAGIAERLRLDANPVTPERAQAARLQAPEAEMYDVLVIW